jgi:hypothetical protein
MNACFVVRAKASDKGAYPLARCRMVVAWMLLGLAAGPSGAAAVFLE